MSPFCVQTAPNLTDTGTKATQLRTGYEQVAFPLGEVWRTYTRRLQHYLGHASTTNTVRYTAMSAGAVQGYLVREILAKTLSLRFCKPWRVDTRTIQAYLGHKSIPGYGALHRAGAYSLQELVSGLKTKTLSISFEDFLNQKVDPRPVGNEDASSARIHPDNRELTH